MTHRHPAGRSLALALAACLCAAAAAQAPGAPAFRSPQTSRAFPAQAELDRLAALVRAGSPAGLEEVFAACEAGQAVLWKVFMIAAKDETAAAAMARKAKFDEIGAWKPEIWETDAEYMKRTTDAQEAVLAEIRTAGSAVSKAIDAAWTVPYKAYGDLYAEALRALSTKTWTLDSAKTGLEIGPFDRNSRTWPFALSSADPALPVAGFPVVAELGKAADPRKAIVDLDAAVKAGRLAGELAWSLKRLPAEDRYEIHLRAARVRNLDTKEAVASWEGEQLVAVADKGKLSTPTKAEATYVLSSKEAGTRASYKGRDLGYLPLSVKLPSGNAAFRFTFADGSSGEASASAGPGGEAKLEAKKPALQLAYVEGGEFAYGANGTYAGTKVRVGDFFVGRTEITQRLYKEIVSSNPSGYSSGAEAPDRPVEQVSWYMAIAFCNLLSEREGLVPVYEVDGSKDTRRWGSVPKSASDSTKAAYDAAKIDAAANGYRLPTQAEWEYAARGGRLSGGQPYAGSADYGEVAWYKPNADKPQPVGKKKPNELGLHDMSGNVAEWCWDWSGSSYAAGAVDPTGPEKGTARTNRGGSYWNNNTADPVGVHAGFANDPLNQYNVIGFRVVRSAAREAPAAPFWGTSGKLEGDALAKAVDAQAKAIPADYLALMVRVPGAAIAAGPGPSSREQAASMREARVADLYVGECETTREETAMVFVNLGVYHFIVRLLDYVADQPYRIEDAGDLGFVLAFCNVVSEISGLKSAYAYGGSTDVAAFIDAAEDDSFSLDKLSAVPGADGYRLPTSVEWSHAARGLSGFPWFWGNDPAAAPKYARTNEKGGPFAVKTKAPNAYGLYDAIGNARELVLDRVAAPGGKQAWKAGSIGGSWDQPLAEDAATAVSDSIAGAGFRMVREAR